MAVSRFLTADPCASMLLNLIEGLKLPNDKPGIPHELGCHHHTVVYKVFRSKFHGYNGNAKPDIDVMYTSSRG